MSERNSIADIINSINVEIVNTHNTPPNFFVLKDNKDKSQSVWIKEPVTQMTKKLTFNYKSGKKHTITIKDSVLKKLEIPVCAELRKRKSDIKNTYIAFDELNEEAVQFIKSVAIYYVDNFEPSDKFGCCSKYKECSNAKKCLHENLFYSKACWYRKNLESGNILY